jgi:hypothetical protein
LANPHCLRRPYKAASLFRPSLSGRRCLGVAQPLEAGKLVCEQFALFIAPNKDLEHSAVIDVDELQRAGSASEEQAVDKIDRGASRNAQVAARRALLVNIEIATRLVAGGSGPFVSKTPFSVWTMKVTGPQSTRSPQISANRAPGADLAAGPSRRSSTSRSGTA